MGWKLTGGNSGVDVDVDTTFKAMRVSLRPAEVTGWNSIGAQSGAVTTAAAAGALFSLRQIASTLLIVRRVGCGFVTTTAFTTPQRVDYGLIGARAFSVSDSGGTAITVTGNNGKMRTSLATPTSIDCRIATTGALTAGTKTLDTNTMSQVAGWVGAVGAGISPSLNNLHQHDAGDYPLVLAQNEGLNIQNITLMGAAGVGQFYANVEFAEASSY